MRKHKLLPIGAAVVAVSVLVTAVWAADVNVKEEVEKLANTATKNPNDLQKQADALAKNKDVGLDDVMNLMKKRTADNPDPFGIGDKPTGKMDDGIEVRIQNLAKKVNKDEFKDQKAKDDMVKALNRAKAIAAFATARKPEKKMGCKDPKDWQEYAERMVKGTDDLKKAVESGDAATIKKAAANLNSSCTDCHAKFRD